MLGAEFQRPPARLALEVRHVEPAAAIDADLGVLIGGQIAIASEQEVVRVKHGFAMTNLLSASMVAYKDGSPSIRTDPVVSKTRLRHDGQART